MSLVPLAVLYALIGTGCLAAWLAADVQSARGRGGHVADAVLLVCLWPLHGPFLLMREREPAPGPEPGLAQSADSTEVAFLAALRRASDTPLGAVLPDQAQAMALAARLRVARAKVHEIDGILAQPAFDEADARQRLDELRGRSASEYAISTATMRLANIRRLRALRNRFATELDEVGELVVQLTTQAEVVRLTGAAHGLSGSAGSAVDTPTADLIRELISRVEGLDQVLDDDPALFAA